MKFNTDNNTLTLYLSGRRDAANAAEIGNAISAAIAEHPELTPAFDAGELEYISSAGLRVLLKFRKQFGKNLDVLNASNEVFDIFEVTGFTELLNVKKRLREISLDGLEVIGRGYTSTVYRIDTDTIVKVFTHPLFTPERIEADQKISREVFLHDIPTAISFDVVRCGEYYGLVYEMIDADTVSGTLKKYPERLQELSIKMARLMKKLHTTEFTPGTFPDARDILRKVMQRVLDGKFITADDKDFIDGLIDRIPDGNTFVHADYHPKNVMVTNNELVLIDVGDAALGNPITDLLITYSHFVSMARWAAKRGTDAHEQAVGLDWKTLGSMWDIIMPEYFGTTDHETLNRYAEILSNYAPIAMLCLISEAPIPEERRALVVAPLVESLRNVKDTLNPIAII